MITAKMVSDWLQLRADLAAVERAEHPDLTDHHGRVWTWVAGDLYRHCGMAWPRHSIEDTRHGLPSATVRANPNYDLCDICKGVTGSA
jgi:hypothetical protein